jgi:hypothetical protein
MKSILATILLLSGLQAQAICPSGPSTSGGGGAFVCRDSNGQVTSSELLDLWEAKNLLNWKVEYSKDPVDAQIKKALSRLASVNSHIASEVEKELVKIRSEAFYLPATIALNAPLDANHLYTKPGCPLEGMLYYDGNRMPSAGLVVDNTIFKKLLTTTDVAASWIHEAYYKVYRDMINPGTMAAFGLKKDSVSSRKMTGCLFSTGFPCLKDLSQEMQPASGASVFKCSTQDLDFEAYPLATGEWVYKFSRMATNHFAHPAYVKSMPPSTPELIYFDNVNGLVGGLYHYGIGSGTIDRSKIELIGSGSTAKLQIYIEGWSTQLGEMNHAANLKINCQPK